jgi:hypothetical protein
MNEQEKKAFLKRLGYTGCYREGMEKEGGEEEAAAATKKKKGGIPMIAYNSRPIARRKNEEDKK